MKRTNVTNYDEAVEYLLNIPRFTNKNTVEDTQAFLRRLGNPDKEFQIIHVAGTNGKGSVCAYLRYMLEEAGYGVCSFTSPHLVDVRERFLVRGRMVGREEFLKAFFAVYDLIPWEAPMEDFYHPTFFEYLFFMSMILFRDAKPDYVILETGLGGRLDATNSVSHKELAVITRIGLDHMEYLGDTLEEIAGEKAGIIAPGAPAVYLADLEGVSAVFDERAKKVGAFACPVSKKDYTLLNFQNKNIDFSLRTRYYKDISASLRTAALYQAENAALAVRALEELDQGRTVTARQIRAGLLKCFWPGRMEEVAEDVFVDGAHNEDGVRAFLESVARDDWQGSRTLLFSAVKDKRFEKMLGEIVDSRLFEAIYFVPMQTSRGASVEVLEGLAREFVAEKSIDVPDSPMVGSFGSVEEALEGLIRGKRDDQRIYVAGSLYLVGEVKASLGVFGND